MIKVVVVEDHHLMLQAVVEQLGGVVLAVGRLAPAQQRAAAFGNRREQVGEESVGHESPANPILKI